MLKKLLKSTLFMLAPTTAIQLSAARARRHAQMLEINWGLVDETHRFVAKFGNAVCCGPFSGMSYPPRSLDRHVTDKLLGTYEMELHPFLEEAIKAGPEQVIDVGPAEGYYAVGLARSLPDATITAFDADSWARERTAEMAQVNGSSNLQTRGLCTGQWLVDNVRDKTLVIMDCEGCELGLTASIASCRSHLLSWWLIELHETQVPGVTRTLLQRFNKTHHAELCTSRSRDRGDLPGFLKSEMDLPVLKWMDEHRDPGQQWLLCRPRPS
ncbi:MAG: hypothetical protein M0Z50_19065 [Planctomycetia bacterium]|nr:hypothetical protein [Planctomycetia bacterium]